MSFEHSRTQKGQASRHTRAQQRKRYARKRRLNVGMKVALVVGTAVVVLGAIFYLNAVNSQGSSGNGSTAYPYVVANPGQGQVAPEITLPATNGTTFDLAAQRGKTVLLFFQEVASRAGHRSRTWKRTGADSKRWASMRWSASPPTH